MKKYRKVMSHGTEEWWKVWWKTVLIPKMTFGEFYCEWRQIWKFALWCATFVECISCLSQKSTEELYVITLKNDAKYEEELALKNDKEFGKFWHNTWKSQNLHFNGLLLAEVYNNWAIKVQRSYDRLRWMQTLKEK